MNLPPGEVHLWFTFDEEVTDTQLLGRYRNLLSHAEREQRERFVFAGDRHRYLVTRALQRSVLSLYAPGVEPQSWQFASNSHGKPAILLPGVEPRLRFNISRATGLIVLAVSREKELGVDVEYVLRGGETSGIATRCFSPREAQELIRLPGEQHLARFFDLWTLKEAYIKACGLGLAIPLHDFEYVFSSAGRIEISFSPKREDEPHSWHFWQLAPDVTHKVAVAIKDATPRRRYSLAMYRCVPLARMTRVDYEIFRSSYAGGAFGRTSI